ncbi:MAG: bifunctional diaminohydroxyphosphoribosylaminopyrimidine deaminase/5-amino-6-(5-phosphoribosylamino)uracil reductase RibD [Synergistaceae bacterium]|nr:bifunctional diaminohydroxyphosphoribosylaminopyrimidine deaminase/5-amino-6-(5-phosphoribosylamino)uracil reductase RibD [Synergistaceae bacterium]
MDKHYIKHALELAAKGTNTLSNPRVGCVIARDGEIIGAGWHERRGSAHAEVMAFNDMKSKGASARGATLYVTLEPCSHFGLTPPCASRIVEEGVSRVVIGMRDPNPIINGEGIRILKDAGIEALLMNECGEEGKRIEAECKWMNRGFIRRVTLNRPWVTIKAAVSLDGKIALAGGESKWITGVEARTAAHELRAEHDGILVGIGTILKDDPELTVRLVSGRSPTRVILDTRLKTPDDARVLGKGTIIICSESVCESKPQKKTTLEKIGARVVAVREEDGHISLREALKIIASDIEIQRLLVEGGGTVHSSFIEGGFADAAALFIAPRFLGQGIGVTNNLRVNSMEESEKYALRIINTRRVGEDLLVDGIFKSAPEL